MFERFTDRARRAVVLSQEEARLLNHSYIGTEHMLLGLIHEGGGVAARALQSVEIGLDSVRSQVVSAIGQGNETPQGHIPFTPRAKKVLELSLREALDMGHDYIDTGHILLGLIREGDGVAIQVLSNMGADPPALRSSVLHMLAGEHGEAVPAGVGPGGRYKPSGSKLLDHFGRNLTRMASDNALDPVIGRQTEIERMMQILSRRSKNNPILIGEPGVGKTAIVEGLAQRIVAGEVPDTLASKNIYILDLGAVVAGSRYRGDFEDRMKKVLKEIEGNGDIILFIDEIHNLVGAGAAMGTLDAASILKPMLARGELQTVGATTLDEYRRYIEKDSALERRFQPIKVEEPSVSETVLILQGLKDRYESHHSVRFTDGALSMAATLADRYISDRFLPDKAIDLIDEAGSRSHIVRTMAHPRLKQIHDQLTSVRNDKQTAVATEEFERAAELRDKENALLSDRAKQTSDIGRPGHADAWVIDEDEIAAVLAQWTGIPAQRLTEEESTRLLHMEEELHKRIIGQHNGISAVSRATRRTRAGLKDPKRPSGSFIFLGPSGVGKTETAKALTEFLFGEEDSLIQLDMSEYMEKHSVSRLVGAPPGYIGYAEGGQLTEKVRRRPFSVVLLDEIEKADPDVFNTLLQILEDGRLTDAQGRTIDFKNTVIIMTSNVGSKSLSKRTIGFQKDDDSVSYEKMKDKLTDELKRRFRPEFLNRIDEVVVFDRLTEKEVKQIVDLLLERDREQLATQQLDLILTDAAKTFLVTNGYDRELGARPLRRVIQRSLEDPLAEQLLLGIYRPGTTIVVDCDPGQNDLTFEKVDTPDSPTADLVCPPP